MKESKSAVQKIIREYIVDPDGGRSSLRYRLVESQIDGRPSYDIVCRAGEDWYQQEAAVSDVTSDKAAAERLLEALWRGSVTPYGLAETVAEWLLL
jgi:hypothetical protein